MIHRIDPASRDFVDVVAEAAEEAARSALQQHARAGNPVAIWRDGRIELVDPHEALCAFPSRAG